MACLSHWPLVYDPSANTVDRVIRGGGGGGAGGSRCCLKSAY